MKRYFIFFILFISSLNSEAQILTLRDSIVNKIIEFKEKEHLNAIIAGVWKGESEILTTAVGESITLVPANTEMKFRIGGVSEIFFGTLLMMLVDRGKLNLNDKISQWLPDILAGDSVTIKMLINNTSGYKDYVLNKQFLDTILKNPFRYITHEEIINYSINDGQLNFSPGTMQQYSHTNFTILEDVIERITGKKMYQLYEEYIFGPQNLNETGYNINSDIPQPVLHAFSSDRGIYEDATFWSPSWTGGSGPLYSNIYDLGKWAYLFGTGKLLSPDSFKELISNPNVKKIEHGGTDLYFASGFIVNKNWYVQNPSFNGYSGGFGYNTQEQYSVIVYSTESADPKSSAKAFSLCKEIIKILTPNSPLDF